MKKSLCLILSAAVIALTLCSCSIIKDKDVLKDYQYTDANGNTYQYATDADGNIVTKEDGGKETTTKSASASGAGDMTVLVTDENGEYVTNKDGSAVTSKLDSSALMEAAEKMMGETTTKKGSSSGNSSTKKNDTTTKVSGGTGSSSKDLLDDGTKTNKTNLKEKVIDPVIKSGTFTVECNLIADSVSMPTTLAFRGNDFSFTVKMSGLDFRVFSNNGKYYLALPSLGRYGEIDKETFGSTDLAGELVALNEDEEIGSITLVGLCTDICVISNALLIKASLPEVPICVDATCCAGVTPESHENALKAMEACQIRIIR